VEGFARACFDFVSEFLFFATVLLVPGTIALCQSLVDVDSTKAAAGCGIIAATIPVMAVMLIIHGRLVFPIYGIRVDTPEAAALCGHDLLRRPARHLSSLGGRDDCPEFGDENVAATRSGSHTLGSPRLRSTLLAPILGLSDPG
jgi:hypothetical protein